jgi:hypothetical protein
VGCARKKYELANGKEHPMVLESREPSMDRHRKVALDLVAAADALFKRDAQRYNELLWRVTDVRNYAKNLELDDTDTLIPPADIICAALIVITRLIYADVSEDISAEDFATRVRDLLSSVELHLIDASPAGEWSEWISREEFLLPLWSSRPPEPRLADELQWVTLQELEQLMDSDPVFIGGFDITQPSDRCYGVKLHQTPPRGR